jgi:hypothetical protein
MICATLANSGCNASGVVLASLELVDTGLFVGVGVNVGAKVTGIVCVGGSVGDEVTGICVGISVGVNVAARVTGVCVGISVGGEVTGVCVGISVGGEVTGICVGGSVGDEVTGVCVGISVGAKSRAFWMYKYVGNSVGISDQCWR